MRLLVQLSHELIEGHQPAAVDISCSEEGGRESVKVEAGYLEGAVLHAVTQYLPHLTCIQVSISCITVTQHTLKHLSRHLNISRHKMGQSLLAAEPSPHSCQIL